MNTPYHHLNTDTGWEVFADQPNVIKTHQPYHFKWQYEKGYGGYNHQVGFVSLDGGLTWVKYDYNWTYANKKEAEKIEVALRASREVHRKHRAKKLAKERKILNENEAKKKGISVEELLAGRKAERDAKSEERRLIMRADKTQKLMKAGPTLKKLYDDLGVFLKLIADGKSPKLPYFEQNLKRIEDAQERVQMWRQSVEKE